MSLGTMAQFSCPTPPDYLSTPFTGPNFRIINLTSTCQLKYYYCWRNAGPYHDMYICGMELIGHCSALAYDILNNFEKYKDMMMLDAINNQNPWGMGRAPECCPPSTTTPCWTDWTWRMGNASCYSEFFWDPKTGKRISIPCNDKPMGCWDLVRFCWTWEVDPITGERYQQLHKEKRVYMYGANCPPTGGPNNDLKCFNVCK